MEYVKTHLQLQQRMENPKYTGMISCTRYTYQHHGVLGFYRGLLPVLMGSIPKAGIRFGGFNMIQTQMIKQNNGKAASPFQNLLAGMTAGAIESTVAVTPIETVKTKLIHANKGFLRGFLDIVKLEGIRGVYQGWAATTLKQSSNQGLRFMAFSFYKSQVLGKDHAEVGRSLTAVQALAGGMCSGCFSTICNNPFDMAKTRMQGLEASQYRSFFHCIGTIVKKEGVLALWSGVGPRLSRVVPGQGIIFMSYEQIASQVQKLVE